VSRLPGRSALRRYGPLVGLCAAVVLAQVLLTTFRAEYFLVQLTMAAWYSLVAIGLCLLMGHTGQVSMGHAGFFAIGGYSSAVLTTLAVPAAGASAAAILLRSLGILVARQDPLSGADALAVAPWAAFLCAVILAAAVAFLVGIPVLRLKGHYLAMATLAFGFIVSRLLLGLKFCGEADGLSGIPAFRLFAGLAVSGKKALRIANYYEAWTMAALACLVAVNLMGSRTGRALRAIHGDEDAAAAMGVDVARAKLSVFVLSAVFSALGGIGIAHFSGGIGPGEAGVLRSVRYVALVAAGGMGSLWGTLAVSAALTFLSLRGAFGLYDDAVFGAILVAAMLFAPEGVLRALSGGARRAAGLLRGGGRTR
jgi:branched-chain amino acid transport system permease protein